MSLYPFPSSAIFNAPFTLKPLPSPIPLELILKPPEKFSTANAYDGRLKISDQSLARIILSPMLTVLTYSPFSS